MWKYKRIKKRPHSRTFKLRGGPHVAAVIWRIVYRSPKKPNSGKRRVAKAKIKHCKRRDRLTARLIGYDFFPRKFFSLLIRGGRANDVPGVTYSAIRGAYDFRGHFNKIRRRSFYGLKRPTASIKHIPHHMRKQGIRTIAEIVNLRRFL